MVQTKAPSHLRGVKRLVKSLLVNQVENLVQNLKFDSWVVFSIQSHWHWTNLRRRMFIWELVRDIPKRSAPTAIKAGFGIQIHNIIFWFLWAENSFIFSLVSHLCSTLYQKIRTLKVVIAMWRNVKNSKGYRGFCKAPWILMTLKDLCLLWAGMSSCWQALSLLSANWPNKEKVQFHSRDFSQQKSWQNLSLIYCSTLPVQMCCSINFYADTGKTYF